MTINITTHHPQYDKYKPRWTEVNDICDGENVTRYIHDIRPDDQSDDNKARNKSFKRRAVFSAIAGYTSRGLVGMVFSKWPQLNVPSQLEYVKTSINGAGISIYQQSQEVTKDLVRVGRCGLFVDFPANQGELSVADMQSGEMFAPVLKFDAEQILNWNTVQEGGQEKLSLVVLHDTIRIEQDDYIFDVVDVLYELRLIEGAYVFREWRQSLDGGAWTLVEEVIPTDGAGNTWNEIPFVFVGSEANTPDVDPPPSYDLVRLNVGHLNNSAIYEDSVFICGQPQPWISGIDFDWVTQAQNRGMYFGAPVMLPVPQGEQFGIAQAEPNSMAKEAMDDKIALMIGMGAMFIQPGSAAKTATQAEGEQVVQHSVLSLIASNVSEAYQKALQFCARYMNAPEDDIMYTLSQKFVDANPEPQMLQQVIAGFLQGAISPADYHRWMKRNELTDEEKTLEEFTDELNRDDNMPDLDAD